MSFPLGTHYEMLGEYNERQAAQRTLLSTAAIAIVAILLLLQLAFGSWRLATFTLITLPMALVGGALAVFLGGGIITIGALVGFFTVFGIAARNGILLINHCQHLEEVEGEPFGKDLVLQGHRERLSPILMTSLATGLALVPLRVQRRPAGSRDRISAGRGHPRRSGHLDAADPVRDPVALSEIRQAAGLDATGRSRRGLRMSEGAG